MHGGYARGVRKQAARQARAMVELLGHHPSDRRCGARTTRRSATTRAARAGRERDRCRRGARKCSTGRRRARSPAYDGTRPVRPQLRRAATTRTSGSAGATATSAGSRPRVRAVPRLGRLRLRVRRAVGARHRASGCSPERWPDLDWDDARRAPRHASASAFDAHVPAADAKSFDEWRDATQAYQAALLQLQIEDLRRCKGAPSGGFAVFCARRPAARGRLRPARPRARARSARTPRCATRAGPCCRWSTRARATCTSSTTAASALERRRDRGRRSTAACGAGRGDIDADAIVFVGTRRSRRRGRRRGRARRIPTPAESRTATRSLILEAGRADRRRRVQRRM